MHPPTKNTPDDEQIACWFAGPDGMQMALRVFGLVHDRPPVSKRKALAGIFWILDNGAKQQFYRLEVQRAEP